MKKSLFVFITILIVFLGFSIDVKADMIGPTERPSIEVCLKNIKDKNYKIDLLIKPNNPDEFYNEVRYDYTNELYSSPIYKYNKDGWIAESVIFNSYFPQPDKNNCVDFYHIGALKEFKVIIELSDGTIKVSKKIIRNENNYNINLDVDTMKVTKRVDFNSNINLLLATSILIIITIAILFDMHNILLIFFVNIFALIAFQAIKLINVSSYTILIVVTTIIISIIEFLIYKKYLLDINNPKLISYILFNNILLLIPSYVPFSSSGYISIIYYGIILGIITIIISKLFKYFTKKIKKE